MSACPLPFVLFCSDYGEVLSGPPDPAVWAKMLAITGLDQPAFDAAYWAHRHDYDRGVHSGTGYWRAAGQHASLDLTDAQIAQLIAADNELWTVPNQLMIDFAQRLQTAGIRTGVLSNLGDAMMHGVLAAMPWLTGFDYLLWSHTLGLAKPEPEIYRRAAEGLDTLPELILFIDDREVNIAGAVAAGMQAIRYTSHDNFVREMDARGWGELYRAGMA